MVKTHRNWHPIAGNGGQIKTGDPAKRALEGRATEWHKGRPSQDRGLYRGCPSPVNSSNSLPYSSKGDSTSPSPQGEEGRCSLNPTRGSEDRVSGTRPKVRKIRNLRFFQLNAHHSKGGSASIQKILSDRDAPTVAFIQEPWHYKNEIRGLRTPGYTTYSISNSDTSVAPRAALVCSKDINAVFMPQLSCRDISVVKTVLTLNKGRKVNVLLCSAYLAGDEALPVREFHNISAYCRDYGTELICGMDANAHNTVWGSTDTNSRGEELLDLFLEQGWEVLNHGEDPTFITVNRSEVLDLSVCSSGLSTHLSGWHVSDTEVLSDHRLIAFDLGCTFISKVQTRDPRRTDWNAYTTRLQSGLPNLQYPNTHQEIERYEQDISKAIIMAFEASCPSKTVCRKRTCPWWNSQTKTSLQYYKQKSKYCFKQYQRLRTTETWEQYKAMRNRYTHTIAQAKRDTWRIFCQEIGSMECIARLSKLLKGRAMPTLGMLKLPSGRVTSSEEQAIDYLMQVHFPNSASGESKVQPQRSPTSLCRKIAHSAVTQHCVRGAISELLPYKAPGLDGIYPVLLQRGLEALLPHLVLLYRASLISGYIPIGWRNVRVVFLPKPGKTTYSEAKSWRPICLSSFLLKVNEKLVDRYLKCTYLVQHPLHKNQHAYQAGKSTETALHNVLSKVQYALEDKQYALACFLDLQGAFDNAQFEDIRRALSNRQVAPVLMDWAMNCLSLRSIQITVGSVKRIASITQGTAQGGVLSALWFVLVIDELLVILNQQYFYTVGYSDDTTILLVGRDLTVLGELMQQALRAVESWCARCKMQVSPEKSELMLFTTRYKPRGFTPVRLNGLELRWVSKVKYLGLWLDPKLKWSEHIRTKCGTAIKALWQCRQSIRATWGATPKVMKWIYECVLMPMVTYGALFWAHALESKINRSQLDKVQRLAALMITSGMRTAPLRPLEILGNLLPIDLKCRYIARRTAYRFQCLGLVPTKGRGRPGYLKIWDELRCSEWHKVESDLMPAWFTPTPRYTINPGNSTEIPDVSAYHLCFIASHCYRIPQSDYSVVTAGFYNGFNGDSMSIHLPVYSNSWQGELYALVRLCQKLRKIQPSGENFLIFVANQTVLYSLSSYRTSSKLVRQTIKALQDVSRKHSLEIRSYLHFSHPNMSIAQQCAREVSTSPCDLTNNQVGVPPNLVNGQLLQHLHELHVRRWTHDVGHSQSHLFLGYQKPSPQQSRWFLSLKRPLAFILTGIITGHAPVRKHLCNLGLCPDNKCEYCHTGATDSTWHFLCECKHFQPIRQEILGASCIDKHVTREIEWQKILQFALQSKRFESVDTHK